MAQTLDRWIGDALASGLVNANGVASNRIWTVQVNRILKALCQDRIPPKALILDTAVINAWTIPGNIILLTRGLMEWAYDDDTLAGVIAHELGHVERRHAWRQLSQSALLRFVVSNTTAKQPALRLVLNALSVLTALYWSRTHEREADRFAGERLALSGYAPTRWWRFLNPNASLSPLGGLFSTHPDDPKRLIDLQHDYIGRVLIKVPLDEQAIRRRARLGFDIVAQYGEAITARGDAISGWEQLMNKLSPIAARDAIASPLQKMLIWNTPLLDVSFILVATQVFILQEKISHLIASLYAVKRFVYMGCTGVEDQYELLTLCLKITRYISESIIATTLVLADLQTRLGEPSTQMRPAHALRFMVREGLMLRSQQDIDRAMGALERVKGLTNRLQMLDTLKRLDKLCNHDSYRSMFAITMQRDFVFDPGVATVTDARTVAILLLVAGTDKPRSVFTYVVSLEVAVMALVQFNLVEAAARYINALCADSGESWQR